MYLLVLLFEFSCTLLARLKAAHLLQPYYKQFQAHPSLLLRRFHVAFPALPLPPTPSSTPLPAFPGAGQRCCSRSSSRKLSIGCEGGAGAGAC
jgi:hypothetical protein